MQKIDIGLCVAAGDSAMEVAVRAEKSTLIAASGGEIDDGSDCGGEPRNWRRQSWWPLAASNRVISESVTGAAAIQSAKEAAKEAEKTERRDNLDKTLLTRRLLAACSGAFVHTDVRCTVPYKIIHL